MKKFRRNGSHSQNNYRKFCSDVETDNAERLNSVIELQLQNVKKLKQISQSVANSCANFLYIWDTDSKIPRNNLSLFPAAYDTLAGQLRIDFHILFSYALKIIPGNFIRNDLSLEDSAEYLLFENEIKILDDSERLYIKMPLLFSKNLRTKGKNPKHELSEIYVDTLSKKMGEWRNEADDQLVSSLCAKNISYIFVRELQKGSIPDSDNYETNMITDAISVPFFGDSPDTTSFFYLTINATDIAEGTYIIISPGAGNILSENAAKMKLRSLFSP